MPDRCNRHFVQNNFPVSCSGDGGLSRPTSCLAELKKGPGNCDIYLGRHLSVRFAHSASLMSLLFAPGPGDSPDRGRKTSTFTLASDFLRAGFGTLEILQIRRIDNPVQNLPLQGLIVYLTEYMSGDNTSSPDACCCNWQYPPETTPHPPKKTREANPTSYLESIKSYQEWPKPNPTEATGAFAKPNRISKPSEHLCRLS